MNTYIEERFNTIGVDEYADLLLEYNRSQPGHIDPQNFTCILKDLKGTIIGKVNFTIRADWLMVNYIGVLKNGNRCELATVMLRNIEQFAKTKKVENISISTISTETNKVLKKLGYEVTHTENYTPVSIVSTLFTKKL